MSVEIKEELQNFKAELGTFKDSVMAYLLEMKQNSDDRSNRPKVFCKKGVLFEISQNSQENTFARVSLLVKLQASGLQLY